MTDDHKTRRATSGTDKTLRTEKDKEAIHELEAKVAADHTGHAHKSHGHAAEAHAQPADSHEHDHDNAGHDHHDHEGHDHGDDHAGHDHSAHDHAGHDHSGHAHADVSPEDLKPVKVAASGEGMTTAIRIMQMDCATEETLIDNKLGGMDVVKGLNFNLMQRVLTVVHEPEALDEILKAITSLGFKPQVLDQASAAGGMAALAPEPKKPWWPLAVAGVAAIAAEAVDWAGMPEIVSALLALLAVGICGWPIYKKGWIAIANLNLNINALMSIAVTGAMVLRQWPEAAMVMVLFAISELIEAKSMDRARNAIQGLMSLTSETATVKQSDGSWKEIDVKDVAMDAIVRVKPGERIGLDGLITSGRSSINQAPITGESLPVDKGEGDQVFAGTINESGSFEYKVTAAAGNTTLAKIIRAVESAQGAKAPTQRFVDQFSRIYTPIVFAIALGVAVVPPLFMGGDWMAWVYKALVMLVIACPCALVISTPVTIVSGLATAAKNGILVKGGVYLEEGRKLKWLALDKTGTITHGKPVQTDFIVLGNKDEGHYRALAASLASRSDHPVSHAVAKMAENDKVKLLDVADFEALPGKGTKGKIDGATYYLGNHRLTHERGLCSPELEERLNVLEKSGKTVIVLTDDKTVMALFAVADTVKDSSRVAIAELHKLGVKTVMLTGDNEHTARAIAKEVGIDEALGDQLPENKLVAVKRFQKDGKVGMVGDGINDAPALAQADVGFAMGAMGTDTAIETADVALMDDDLRKIGVFVRLSQKTRAVLIQNISFALGLKAIFLVITLIGLGTMWMAVFADVGASLIVVANGLRLLRKINVEKIA